MKKLFGVDVKLNVRQYFIHFVAFYILCARLFLLHGVILAVQSHL